MPFGRLREPMRRGRARAFRGGARCDAERRARRGVDARDQPVRAAARTLGASCRSGTHRVLGIGTPVRCSRSPASRNPAQFFEMLSRRRVWTSSTRSTFADHHRYSASGRRARSPTPFATAGAARCSPPRRTRCASSRSARCRSRASLCRMTLEFDGWDALDVGCRCRDRSRAGGAREAADRVRAGRRPCAACCACMPHASWCACSGASLGLMFYALDRAHRRVALTNLEQCFPQRPAARAARASRARCSRTSAGCSSSC